MSKEDKYYTPELKEFHVGFEYEQYEDYDNPLQDKEWHKLVFGLYGTDNPENMTYPGSLNIIRVKLLDREDIESLGFELISIEHYMKGDWFLLLNRQYPYKLELRNRSPSWAFGGFHGTIKNKSELKRLLKRIGV